MRQFSNLANVVTTRTYARKTPNGLENFSQIVERVIQGNVKNHNVSEYEIQRLRYFLTERLAGPAGRGWWMSGTAAQDRLGGAALVNCWAAASDTWENWVVAQDLLMLGGGIGWSVEGKYVEKLPEVKEGVFIHHKFTKDADYIVPDSREGWCELTRRVLEAFFVTGKGFSYSTICVRTAGEPINGFGGTASGPKALVTMVEKICAILSARSGTRIRPIDSADVMCCVGEMVVAGNVRRSAILLLGDASNKNYLKAKRWDLGPIPTQRAMANFSVVADDVDHDLRPLFWGTYDQGEPFGIVNLSNIQKYGRMGEIKKDTANMTNPCQPAWATVLTPQGISTIGQIKIGDLIWSGKRWTKVVNKWSTGVKDVHRYHTTAGFFLGTENHKVVSSGEKIEVKDASSIDMALGMGWVNAGKLDPQDVMDGLVIGDGMTHKASNNLTLLCIGKDDGQVVTNSEVSHLFIKQRDKLNKAAWEINTTIEGPLPKTYNRSVPDPFRFGSFKKMAGFLRGLFSANGFVVGKRVGLKAASFSIINDVQLMLSALGITSYYTVNKGKDIKFSNGTYHCKQSYDLNISNRASKIIFSNIIGFIHDYKNEKLKKILETPGKAVRPKQTFDIKGVYKVSTEEVFDITVDDPDHTYWTGGLLVSNCGEALLTIGSTGGKKSSIEPCNLTEINLAAITSPDEFEEAARLMHRWGKRVTCETYHWPQCDDIIKQNRRVGTGITGCVQNTNLFNPDVLDRVYAAIQDENVKYSAELNIPPSIRTTVIKPSGTWSKMMDCPCEGIHPAYSRYFIQRIRLSSSDQLVEKLRAAGHHIEPQIRLDGSYDPNTVVADFYVRTPEGTPCADDGFDTWKQLDAVKMAQKHWADQSISVTVYYKDGDVPKIQEWLRENLKEIKTISFLKHSGHGFKQAPKEAISQEQYEKLSAKIKPLDIENVQESDMIGDSECAGGACPIR